jgi:serine protease Do
MKRCSLQTLILALGFAAGSFLPGSLTQAQNPPSNTQPISYRDVVKKVRPAVVSIQVRVKLQAKAKPTLDSPPQDDFGSGFLVTAEGTVVTSYHIVQGAEQVTVRLLDGRKFVSRDIRGDARSDLAIIRIDAKGADLRFLEFGDSDGMEIGDRVLAVGAPFGLTGSVTHGIVSGKGRDLNINIYEDFLQTDAAINPGNSGGPLINLDGKVVGICAAIKSKTGGFQGVGLAVASNLAKGVVESLRKEGVVRRAYVGLQARELDVDIAPRLGLPRGVAGVVVGQVFAKTPAQRAGLQPGDILAKIGGKPVHDPKDLQIHVARLPIGKVVPIEFFRDGKAATVEARIEELPATYASGGIPLPRGVPLGLPTVAVPKLGIELADLSANLVKELGYAPGTRGVLIARVQAGSLSADAGLHAGMLINKVDGKSADTAADAAQMLRTAAPEQGILLQVQSLEGGTTYVLIEEP